MKGPFYNVKEVYTLTGSDFTVGAHLKLLSEEQSRVAGLDIEAQNLEVLCCDPKEGHPALLHDVVVSISPSFRGLDGSVRIQGRPEERLKPVVKAIGLKLYGTFEQSADSVDDSEGWEDWTRRRFVPNGLKTVTGGPDGTWGSEVIRASLVTERGDEVDDFAPVRAEVLARAATLLPADILIHPVHGTFQVRGVENEGEYEKARLER